jgi:murein DD-endopeptidase MepM/ murein hydrolase activator NlpD
MDATARLAAYLEAHPEAAGKVVDFDPVTDRLYHFNFTVTNIELDAGTFSDTEKFDKWITQKLSDNKCKFGVGGYMEHRIIYARSPHFDTDDEPRRLHLGVDIWGKADTPVYNPLPGKVHSFQNNDNFGDYGPTIIIEHNLDGFALYSLYGHLSRQSLDGLYTGKPINSNEQIATLGSMNENGHWPPHLHFQLMFDMQGRQGDYPGVCKFSERDIYLKNIPDPQLILRFPEPGFMGFI